MYEKKSNQASLIVAALAIALILGGVFLLSQSFSKSRSTSSSSSSSVSSSSSSSSSRSSSTSSSLSSSSSSTSSSSSSSVSSSSSSSSSRSSSTSSSLSSSSSSTSSSSSSSSVSKLETNQIIVKIIDDSGPYKVQIIESGVPDAKFLATGKTTTLNFTLKLTKDKVYKLTGVAETEKGFSVSLTKNPEEVA